MFASFLFRSLRGRRRLGHTRPSVIATHTRRKEVVPTSVNAEEELLFFGFSHGRTLVCVLVVQRVCGQERQDVINRKALSALVPVYMALDVC